jgi:hypothetical protein
VDTPASFATPLIFISNIETEAPAIGARLSFSPVDTSWLQQDDCLSHKNVTEYIPA